MSTASRQIIPRTWGMSIAILPELLLERKSFGFVKECNPLHLSANLKEKRLASIESSGFDHRKASRLLRVYELEYNEEFTLSNTLK